MSRKLSKEEFLDSLPAYLHEKYDYSRVVYTSNKDKIEVICRTHNHPFWVTANNHKSKRSGCPICANNIPGSSETFIASATKKHSGAYTYESVVYTNSVTPVTITCHTHGAFVQTPAHHVSGNGCPACGREAQTAKRRHDKETFVAAARAVHGDTYNYDAVEYTNSKTPVTITCQRHGDYQQIPAAHLQGCGCTPCGYALAGAKRRSTLSDFRLAANAVHKGKYMYHATDYVSTHVPVAIECQEHGIFWQGPANHKAGKGCPLCAHTASSQEHVIADAVRSFGVEVLQRRRPAWMNGRELDVFLPEHNLAIEYCGSHVHNSTANVYGGEPKDKWYHYDKWKLCRDNGVTLLTIYDFDWFSNREKWEAVIKHKIQKADRRVFARKCSIVPIERIVAREFCKAHHIEGVGGMWKLTTECKGLEYAGELVAIMACEEGDIKRSCTLSGTAVIGGVSKLFKSFPAGTTMMTTNNTGSSGNYGTLLEKKTLRYWWVKLSGNNPTAFPRRQCQKHLLEAKFGEPLNGRTERQYMEDQGFVKCYDSGLSYWVNR